MLLLYKSSTCKLANWESCEGNVPLNTLLERFKYRRADNAEISGGMGPESWFTATERFCKKRRLAMSGERVPERLKPEISKETT